MKLHRWVLLTMTATVLSIAPLAGKTISHASGLTEGSATIAQSQPSAIASGSFVAGEAPTTGTVRIITQGGHRYLEFDGAFSTSDQGPDLHVLLDATAQPPASYENLGSAINLGALSSFTGSQRYPIPDSIDLNEFQSVVIWCRMANATFGYAPLRPASSASVR